MAHWFGNWPYQASFYEKLRELPHADVMAPKDKHYYVPTETGRYPRPVTEPGVAMGLPAALSLEEPARVSIRVSDDLPRWDETGRVHVVLLRVRIMNTTEQDRFRFRFERERPSGHANAKDQRDVPHERPAIPDRFRILVRVPAGPGPLAAHGPE